MIEFLSGFRRNAVGARFRGKVVGDDLRQLDVRLRHLIDLWANVGLVVVMDDDARFGLSARWMRFRLSLRRGEHVQRIAIVGNAHWEHRARRQLAFTKARTRYFPVAQLAEAWHWVLDHPGAPGKGAS